METIFHSHKRRGFFTRANLAPSFPRAARAEPFLSAQHGSKVKQEDHSRELSTRHDLDRSGKSTGPPWTDSTGCDQKGSSCCCYYHCGFGIGNGDENVDSKAESYISNVRERFKLERFEMD